MRTVVADIETNGLENVQNIWCIVCKDVNSHEVFSFSGDALGSEFKSFAEGVGRWIGHNFIRFDGRWITRFLGIHFSGANVIDTLVLSRMLRHDLEGGHSLEAWGERLGHPKTKFDRFHEYGDDMLSYCKDDVTLNHLVYDFIMSRLGGDNWKEAIKVEMEMQYICMDMEHNGFKFDFDNALKLYKEVDEQVKELDIEITKAFPARTKLVREINPSLTKAGTLHRKDFKWYAGDDYTIFSEGCPFSLFEWEAFNPGSPKQVVDRLWEAGWEPTERTKGHIKNTDKDKQAKFERYGWALNEANLSTLPDSAPLGARYLVKRMLLAARLRTLNEWFQAYNPNTCRIHGTFNPLGTRTQRCAHSNPNLGNIATAKSIKYNTEELRTLATELGSRMRSLWICDDDKKGINYCLEFTKELQLTRTLFIPETMRKIKEQQTPFANASENTTDLKTSTKSLSKTLKEWLKNKKLDVFSVKEQTSNSLLITVITQDESAVSYADSVIHSLVGMRIEGILLKSISSTPTIIETWLCGTDMESAHLRIFGHLINDKEYIQSLLTGDKKHGTDPHSLNKRKLGSACVDRDRAKTFVFSFLNGAGGNKVAQIFGCDKTTAKASIDMFIEAYPGLARLKEYQIPKDARRRYFEGVDGRYVYNDSEHHMIGFYLQNAESVLMKHANVIWRYIADKEGLQYKQVNWVHDEVVTEVKGSKENAYRLGKIQAWSISYVGRKYKLNCPMSGEYKVGKNWLEVH